ncbi:MAG: DedA family protein [Candidatus Doudnabacteria bacterium]|nr:DedA family protein [Candidatus Doudnabacteria bacterium]
MVHFVNLFLSWIEASKYTLLFFGSIAEGPILTLTSGFLVRLKQLDLVPAYFLLVAGDFTADIVWYNIGRHGARRLINRFGSFFNITPEIISKVEKRFHTYQTPILFLSKITMGFGFGLATLLVAGMLKVPLKNYILLNLTGGLIWTALLLILGYFFGNAYILVAKPFRAIFLALLILLVGFGLYGINRYLVKKEI